jgi:signal transduction histidine kinase
MGHTGAGLTEVAVPLASLDSQLPDGPGYRSLKSHSRALAWGVLAVTAAYAVAEVAVIETYAMVIALSACGALGAGGTLTAIGYRRALERAACRERRRIARDLHDGLAQELAYIRMETLRIVARGSDDRIARLAIAAERALEESRVVIAGLHGEGTRPFPAQLCEVAEQLTERAGARLTLDLEPAIEVDAERGHALLRILREAITNGVRHGRATEVALQLTAGDGLRMSVHDNGAGFVPGGPRRGGSFGLTTMRERAQALGGDLTVRSNPGEGTVVEVVLP